MQKFEPKVKTWREPGLAESGGNQSAHNSGSREKQSRRESGGMKALARPLKLGLPPGADGKAESMNTVDKKQDRPFLPANLPHEHE